MPGKLPPKYGSEPLTLRNIDSCLIRRGLAEAVQRAVGRWKGASATGTLLDVGCGAQPYRAWVEETGLDYAGVDWPSSIHSAASSDTVQWDLTQAPWPFDAARFDYLLCTEVLEHQPYPLAFLQECARVCRPGAEMLLTAPLVWPEHEQPHDYFRYTQYGLTHLLGEAGFEVVEMWPRGGWHLALAQTLGVWSYFAVPKPWNYVTRALVWPIMLLLAWMDKGSHHESRLPLTLGFAVIARRKAA